MANKAFTESQNPVLSEELIRQKSATVGADGEVFRMSSAINKTLMLSAILLATAVVGYMYPSPIVVWGGAIGALIVVFLTVRKIEKAGTYAPMYAALEGLFVGGVSAMYATLGNGIILQAISLTFLVFFMMLVIHKLKIIPVTQKFRMGIVMATGAICGIYLLTWVLSFFGIYIPFIHEGGTFGILFSLFVLGIAALNLLLDFDLFVKADEYGAPEYMEWFAGMSLLITLVWIYIEVLRLLSKTRN